MRHAMTYGSLTLADLRGRIAVLEVACSRCDRRGRYRLAWLIAEHRQDMRLPDLRLALATGCPKAQAHAWDRCDVHFPGLVPELGEATEFLMPVGRQPALK